MPKQLRVGSLMVLAVALVLLAWTVNTIQAQPDIQRPDVVPLDVQIVSSQFLAVAGDRQPAYLVAAVNDERGPVSSLTKDNFALDMLLPPPGTGQACLVEIDDVVESTITRGAYRVRLVTLRCDWKDGRYLFTLLANGPNGSGVGVAEMVVE